MPASWNVTAEKEAETAAVECAARTSAFLRPGTWHVDQVGVKAPGRETSSTFLPLRKAESGFGASGVLPAWV